MRDGSVEESERSEGDDVGLARSCRQRQAVVSTNDINGDVRRLAERAVAMARVAPDDKYVGLADPVAAGEAFSRSRSARSPVALDRGSRTPRREAEAAALAVKGVTKSGGASASAGIGGMVLVTSTGFHGAYLARARASR